jgi:hypothetical protein
MTKIPDLRQALIDADNAYRKAFDQMYDIKGEYQNALVEEVLSSKVLTKQTWEHSSEWNHFYGGLVSQRPELMELWQPETDFGRDSLVLHSGVYLDLSDNDLFLRYRDNKGLSWILQNLDVDIDISDLLNKKQRLTEELEEVVGLIDYIKSAGQNDS